MISHKVSANEKQRKIFLSKTFTSVNVKKDEPEIGSWDVEQ